jgi:hypothetical protein
LFKLRKIRHRLGIATAAHLGTGTQAAVNRRPFRHPEDTAEIVGRQLDATDPGRLAAWHAGDR